jgi:hypothetical protein
MAEIKFSNDYFFTPKEFACLKTTCTDYGEEAIVLTLASTGNASELAMQSLG